MDINAYWKAALSQQPEEMKVFFHKDAFVNWHNTNEHFTVNEFIKANCEYPGDWDGEIERIEKFSDLIITVVHVYSGDRKISCHVTSFIKIKDGKIAFIDEYWGDDGTTPQWRLDKHIGTPDKVIAFRSHNTLKLNTSRLLAAPLGKKSEMVSCFSFCPEGGESFAQPTF